MSLYKTKPRNQYAVAARNGWVDSRTGELLVSIRGLQAKLDAESALFVKEEIKEETPVIEETKVEEVVELKEQTAKKPKKNQKIIAEVVEYDLGDKDVIGE